MPLESIPNPIPDDDELFPYGIFKGTKFKNVPAWYLDKQMGQSWIDQSKGY